MQKDKFHSSFFGSQSSWTREPSFDEKKVDEELSSLKRFRMRNNFVGSSEFLYHQDSNGASTDDLRDSGVDETEIASQRCYTREAIDLSQTLEDVKHHFGSSDFQNDNLAINEATEIEPEEEPEPEELQTYYTAQYDDNSSDVVEESLDLMDLATINTRVAVQLTRDRGRCLYASQSYQPGKIIIIEEPILAATPDLLPHVYNALETLHKESRPLELPPIWHLAAIYSLVYLTVEEQERCFNKWTPEPGCPPSDDVLYILENVLDVDIRPEHYEHMLQVWRYNSFGHHSEPNGLVLYNCISMMAHSCNATACWHYGEKDHFILRARVHLNPGDEITISYIGDDDLFKSTNIRREKLHGWLFTCCCSRCCVEEDPNRGFRCPTCSSGNIAFKTDAESKVTSASKCTVCNFLPDAEMIDQYIQFEQAYAARLDETDKTDLADAELVYKEAVRVFSSHWIIFSLHTILVEAYKERHMYDAAKLHQSQRIAFASRVLPNATYALAWLYEEMGDILVAELDVDIFGEETTDPIVVQNCQKMAIEICYEEACSLFVILCGYSHDYSNTTLRKLRRVQELQGTKSYPSI